MNETQIYATLTEIFRDHFGDDSIVLTEATTAADVPEWDSFQHIQLIATAEVKFGVKIKSGEIDSLKSVGDLVRMIQKKLKP